MSNIPSSPRAVPSIHILSADDSALFPGDMLDMYNYYNPEDAAVYSSAPVVQLDCSAQTSELEEMVEFSHLATTANQPYLSGSAYSVPYTSIMQENLVDGGLTPSSLGSPMPSPSSLSGSLSPLSYCESALSDTESLLSPSPTTPDELLYWSSQALSHHFVGSFPNDVISPAASLGPQTGPTRPRSHSSPSTRRGPVASKAMLEANSRRRRHPPQFECEECNQTFTAQFSLRRHAQSHTGERPFQCSIPGCNQRFFNSSDCKRHEKSKKRHKDLLTQ